MATYSSIAESCFYLGDFRFIRKLRIEDQMRVVITGNKAQAIVLNAILTSQTSRKHFGLVPLADLRAQLRYELSRKAQDEALIALAGAGAIVLQYHDYASTVPRAEREAFLKYKGVEYFAASLKA